MIRSAIRQDLPSLLQLENTTFTTDIISANSMRRFLIVNSAEILVAEEEQHIIGSAILLFRKNSKIARIYSIAVSASHRNQGIASNLYQAMEKCALKRYSETMVLEVHPDNHAAIRFYEKKGYVVFGKYPRFYECGSDALRMRKNLS